YFYSPYPELEFNPKAAIPRLLTSALWRGQQRFDQLAGAFWRGLWRLDRIREGRGPGLGLAGALLRGHRRFDRIRDGRGPNINGLGLRRPSSGKRSTRGLGALSGALDVETERECGIGDITLLSLLSPRKTIKICNGEFVWGAGPTLIFPTASPDELGQGKFQ